MKTIACTSRLPLSPAVSMHQHPHYAATIRTLGGRVDVQRFSDGNRVLARVQVIRRKLGPVEIAWVPRGPDWAADTEKSDKHAVLEALGQHLSGCRLRLIGTATDAEATMLGDLGHRPVAPAQTEARLDLGQPLAERLARQHGKWRNRLRHAEKQGLKVTNRPFRMVPDGRLPNLETAQQRHLGYRALPPAFTQAWALANPDATRLFLAEDGRGMVAFLLILLHPPTASYHLGWTSDRGRAVSAHNLLLWRASNWLAGRGITALDMGTACPRATPGLARFKLGIGAEEQRSGPTLLALPRLSLPRLFRRAA